jgi:hypothetical protein
MRYQFPLLTEVQAAQQTGGSILVLDENDCPKTFFPVMVCAPDGASKRLIIGRIDDDGVFGSLGINGSIALEPTFVAETPPHIFTATELGQMRALAAQTE